MGDTKNLLNLISEETFSEKMDALIEAVGDISSNSSVSSDGLVYKNIDISIDSVHSWKYYAKSDSIHVLLPESGKAVAVSQDGRAWKTYALPTEDIWSGLAYGNGKFLIVPPDCATAYMSENGIDWSSVALPQVVFHPRDNATSRIVFYHGYFYIGCEVNSNLFLIRSSDGISWEVTDFPGRYAYTLDMSCVDDLFYLFLWDEGSHEYRYDIALGDWVGLRDVEMEVIYHLAGKSNGKYYARRQSPAGIIDGIMVSVDGITWTRESFPYSNIQNIYLSMNDSIVIAHGTYLMYDEGSGEDISTTFACIYTDGAWTPLDNLDFTLSTLLWSGTEFVNISDSTVSISPDGLTWQHGGKQWIEQAGEDITNDVKVLLTPDTTDALVYYHADVTYEKTSWDISRLTHGSVTREDGTTGNRFVAIYKGRKESEWVWDEETGEEYEVTTYYNPEIAAYSDDGLTWHQTSLPTKGDWSDVCHTGEAFIAVAKCSQTLIYSTDGITWNSTELPTLADWTSIARTRNGIIIVSNGNKVLWGEYANGSNIVNGFTWTEITLESEVNLSRICWAVYQGIGVAVGGSKSVAFNSNREYIIQDLPTTDFIDITMTGDEVEGYFQFHAINTAGEIATSSPYQLWDSDWLAYAPPSVSWSLFSTPLCSAKLIISTGLQGEYNTYPNYLIVNHVECGNIGNSTIWYDVDAWGGEPIYDVAADSYDGKIVIYGTGPSNHTAICISTDDGLTWNYSYSDLLQKGEDVSEGVSDVVWGHIAPRVDKKLPKIPNHLDITSYDSINLLPAVYNANLDRVVRQDFYEDEYEYVVGNLEYSDDGGKTWMEYSQPRGAVCGAIGNVFVFKDYDRTVTWEEVWIEDPVSEGEGRYEEQAVVTVNSIKFFAHNCQPYQEWIECLFKDTEGNTVDLPKQNYRCYSLLGGSGSNDRLILIGDDRTTAAYSEDGIRWTVTITNFSETHGNLEHIASGNGILIACSASNQTGEVSVARSLDGINWTTSKVSLVSIPPNAESVTEGLHSLIYGNGIFVCAYDVHCWVPTDTWSNDYIYSQAIAISTDGVTWNIQTSPSNFPDVFVGNRFIDIGTTSSYYSTDAINWTMYSDSPRHHPGGGNNTDPDFLSYYSLISQITPDYVYVEMVTEDNEYCHNYYTRYTTDGHTWKSVEDSTADIIVKGDENVTAQVSSAILTNIMNTYRKVITPEAWTEDGTIVQFSKTQVTPESIVIVSADINSMTAYEDAGIRCIKQDYGALTFICDTIPDSAINVNIVIIQAPVAKYIPYIEDPRWEEGEEVV